MRTSGNCNSYDIKTIIVENPTDSENLGFILPLENNLEIKRVVAVLPGGSGGQSVTYSLRWGPDRSLAGTEVNVGGRTVTSVTTGDSTSTFNNPIVPANNFLWLTTTAKAGTVPLLEIYIYYELF